MTEEMRSLGRTGYGQLVQLAQALVDFHQLLSLVVVAHPEQGPGRGSRTQVAKKLLLTLFTLVL